jgi:hypothetical protein
MLRSHRDPKIARPPFEPVLSSDRPGWIHVPNGCDLLDGMLSNVLHARHDKVSTDFAVSSMPPASWTCAGPAQGCEQVIRLSRG